MTPPLCELRPSTRAGRSLLRAIKRHVRPMGSPASRHLLRVVADVLGGLSFHGVQLETIGIEDVRRLRPVNPFLVCRPVKTTGRDDSPGLARIAVAGGRPNGSAAVAIDRTPAMHDVHTLDAPCVVARYGEPQVW